MLYPVHKNIPLTKTGFKEELIVTCSQWKFHWFLPSLSINIWETSSEWIM